MGQHFQYKMNDSDSWDQMRGMPCFGWMAELDSEYGISNTPESHIHRLRFSMNEGGDIATRRNKIMPILVEVGNKLPLMKGRFSIPDLPQDIINTTFAGNTPMEIEMDGVPTDWLFTNLFLLRNNLYNNHMVGLEYLLHKGVDPFVAVVVSSLVYPRRGMSWTSQFFMPTGDSTVANPYECTTAHIRALMYGNNITGDQPEWGSEDMDEDGYLRDGSNDDSYVSNAVLNNSLPASTTGLPSIQKIMTETDTRDHYVGYSTLIKELTGKDFGISYEDFRGFASEHNY